LVLECIHRSWIEYSESFGDTIKQNGRLSKTIPDANADLAPLARVTGKSCISRGPLTNTSFVIAPLTLYDKLYSLVT
jgi:hypothetical protein